MDHPLVSVVIPLYNKDHTIETTLKSVVSQSYQDLDIIVVDDGSDDGGLARAQAFPDRRLSIVSQSNQGQSAARNTGIKRSKGVLVAFLDGDDLWDQDHVANLVALYNEYPNSGLYATGYRTIYSRGFMLATSALSPRCRSETFLISDYFKMASVAPFVWVSAVCVPRYVFEHCGLFLEGEHRGADREMWARIALSYQVAYDPRICATYNCAVDGQETGKQRILQYPPLVKLLDDVIESDNSDIPLVSLRKYRNNVLFGYVSNAVRMGSRRKAYSALNQVRILSVDEKVRLYFWKLMLLLPTSVVNFVIRGVGSRYKYWLKSAYSKNNVTVSKHLLMSDSITQS